MVSTNDIKEKGKSRRAGKKKGKGWYEYNNDGTIKEK